MKKSYVYVDSQILAQHDGDADAEIYYYLHDRLGSVRQIIDNDANVVNRYTYRPFGEEEPFGSEEDIFNRFKFAGQYYDREILQYYMRARQYDININRFTSRDPVAGKFQEPMTLHAYLYCINNSINLTDPTGLWYSDQYWGHFYLTGSAMQAMGFKDEFDIQWAKIGSLMPDFRKDASIWGAFSTNWVPHYGAGVKTQAHAHAMGALEMALWFEKQGIHDVSMILLGYGLHTIQDRWAHAKQGIGGRFGVFPGHIISACDNPWRHPNEFRRARQASMNYIEMFQSAAAKGIYDLNVSGDWGEGFDYGLNGGGDIDVNALLGNYGNIINRGVVGTWP